MKSASSYSVNPDLVLNWYGLNKIKLHNFRINITNVFLIFLISYIILKISD